MAVQELEQAVVRPVGVVDEAGTETGPPILLLQLLLPLILWAMVVTATQVDSQTSTDVAMATPVLCLEQARSMAPMRWM